MTRRTAQESQKEIGRALGEAIRGLDVPYKKIEDKFLFWFLQHFYGSRDIDGVDVLITNGPGDGNVDAIVRIPRNRYCAKELCVLVHCTYSPLPGEGRKVTPLASGRYAEFGNLPQAFSSKESLLNHLGNKANEDCKRRYLDIIDDIKDRKLKLSFLLVTLHARVPTFEQRAITASNHVLEKLDFKYAPDVFDVYTRSIHGGTPLAGPISVRFNRHAIFEFRALNHRTGNRPGVTTYITAAVLQDLIDQTKLVGERLFSENVRLERGKTDINEGIKETFLNQADEFFLGHNGISIICTAVDRGPTRLKLFNPSIINGSQTLHVLQGVDEERSEARVLLRIVEVPVGREGRQGLVSDIIERSNSQNAVASWELRANDPIQVKLEHEFSKQGLFYERKKLLWSRNRVTLQRRFEHHVAIVRLAQLLAAATGWPELASKAATLFSGNTYDELFYAEDSTFTEIFAKYAVFRVIDRAFRDSIEGEGYNPRDAIWYFFACVWQELARKAAFKRHAKEVDRMRALFLAKGDELTSVYERCSSLFRSIRSSFVRRAGADVTWNNAFKRPSLAERIIQAVPASKISGVERAIVETLNAFV
ncbi:MAG: AIPR family protein [Candidatus Cybelea sp.]